ncbi:hypothetical protein CF336_g3539 [Tilletia laevis]|uniref:Uncharacterized protein n=1 Tax=Tilletia caries TaxID=13290 RepID=A0A177VEA9_9BASI|nr:hypothetical protein CF336_g3539 [Tilletia laevis]KAE8261909.1 hypothetical protein A4X03_0g2873 [Tilletia caries]
MVCARLLLIAPFLLLATLAISAPLTGPICPPCSTLSTASSLETRTEGSPSGDMWDPVLQGFVDNYNRIMDEARQTGLYHYENMSPEQKARVTELMSQAKYAAKEMFRNARIIEKVRLRRP